jgi:hypothetical protein
VLVLTGDVTQRRWWKKTHPDSEVEKEEESDIYDDKDRSWCENGINNEKDGKKVSSEFKQSINL